MADHRYLLGLGSNMRHPRHGSPKAVVEAALRELDENPLSLGAASPIVGSAPLGPSQRRYANAAAIIATDLEPRDLLDRLKKLEANFGRRAGGQRWRARVLDIDIVLWSGGIWSDGGLTIPHVAFRQRAFVLRPAAGIAADWRDPLTGLTVAQLAARIAAPKRLDPRRAPA